MKFLWSDAWILQAIAIAAKTTPADLTAILAAADSVNHALPTDDELRGALRRLVDAGYVVDTKGKFRVSSQVPQTMVSAITGTNVRVGREAAAAFLHAEEWTSGSNVGDPRNDVPYPGVTDEILRDANDQYIRRHRSSSRTRRGKPSQQPILFIFAGLPGSGKSTLAQALARDVHAVYIRVDTIEQALRDLYAVDVQGEGYRLAYRIASDNLRLGLNVVADSCNPIELTRREWERVAHDAGVSHLNIEVVCSDVQQHRRRVESRLSDASGLRLPDWNDVVRREYHHWTAQRLVIDTAGRSAADSRNELLRHVKEMQVVS